MSCALTLTETICAHNPSFFVYLRTLSIYPKILPIYSGEKHNVAGDRNRLSISMEQKDKLTDGRTEGRTDTHTTLTDRQTDLLLRLGPNQ